MSKNFCVTQFDKFKNFAKSNFEQLTNFKQRVIIEAFKEANMKAPYKNAKRSREMIKSAMITLLDKKKSISDICISEIVKTADINRGTFYNHYRNPIEVLEEIKDDLFKNLSQALQESSATKNIDNFIDAITNHIKENESTYRTIVNAIPMSAIDKMKEELVNKTREFRVSIDPVTVYFAISGFTGVYLELLKNPDANFGYNEVAEKTKELVKIYLNAKNNQ